MKVYGTGQPPLYDVIATYGLVSCVNKIDPAFQSFDELRNNLSVDDAGFSFSSEFNQFTLAMKVPVDQFANRSVNTFSFIESLRRARMETNQFLN